jgi:hypothetical protein
MVASTGELCGDSDLPLEMPLRSADEVDDAEVAKLASQVFFGERCKVTAVESVELFVGCVLVWLRVEAEEIRLHVIRSMARGDTWVLTATALTT